MSVSRTFKTIRALLKPVLLSIAIAEAGLLVVRTCVLSSDLHNTNDVVGNYLQPLGTIYAVLLAFVVYVVWSQFNENRTYVEREANELLDLFRTAKGLPPERRSDIENHIGKYVDVVLQGEWAAMAKGSDREAFDRGGAILDQLWDVVHDFEPGNRCHEAALMTAAMAGALSHILYLIHDLDNCFDGDWQISRSAFQRVQHFIQRPYGVNV
jgi:RNAse (barnase) inhibitor barstar